MINIKDLLLGNQSDSISEGGQTSLIDIINQKYANSNVLFQSAYHGTPHEVEIKEKLSDVFSRTFQQGTSESSKSIIADLVNNFNPDVNNHEDKRNLLMVHATKEYNIDSILESVVAVN